MGAGLDLVARRADGSTFPVDIALGPLELEGEPYVVASIRNILERKVTERELALAHERLALLEDRERIARDLHDTVIQDIFASGLGLQAILSRLDDPELVKRIETTIERLDGSITRLRNIIFDLRRPTEGGQLSAAIRNLLLAATDDLGFEPQVTIEGDVGLVPLRVEEHLIPTLREALTNVAKHADADSVRVRLTVGSDVVLEVRDNGKGLADAQSPGFGFANMNDRANRLGGTCLVEDHLDGGARVLWTVPSDPPGDA
jgi:signal transduction histidine kinase